MRRTAYPYSTIRKGRGIAGFRPSVVFPARLHSPAALPIMTPLPGCVHAVKRQEGLREPGMAKPLRVGRGGGPAPASWPCATLSRPSSRSNGNTMTAPSPSPTVRPNSFSARRSTKPFRRTAFSARSTATRPERPAFAGYSTPSTARATSSAASPSGPRWSASNTRANRSPASPRRRPCAPPGAPFAATAPTAATGASAFPRKPISQSR